MAKATKKAATKKAATKKTASKKTVSKKVVKAKNKNSNADAPCIATAKDESEYAQ
jgi:hypothetical protein